ncbi:Histone acetyltransferase HPA2 and related acetyltransferases [Hyphomicrobiales bacterium]|nr:Histone acetyltransferase HPA2 and related acetyltransferases [Hyphomicrobiales bacterium]CAH1699992.1 Histone acetyltransferase HPA2 and related acetyltransferases [Hyphomicrobiales bacterium]CAI0343749.1 Acetyltransferase (GNAT) family protein [Hyphomicrobiales bacterium]
MPPQITLTDAEDTALRQVLHNGLRTYNDEKIGLHDSKPLTLRIDDPETGEPIGGLLGRTSLGLLFVDFVYLPESLRGTGIGSRVLAMAEEEGRRRGCSKAVLFTISFQAPEFYKKLGWQVFGEIAPKPPGATRIYLTKDL